MVIGFTGDVKYAYMQKGQFVDVGIAEENAMAMASGVAANGATPVFATCATFLQRTYDQLSHDLCLNNNPAVILVVAPGVYGFNANTHIALCDIQFFAHVPNLVYLAPASKEEYLQMFHFATTQKKHPVAIRVPFAFSVAGEEDKTDYAILNKNKVVCAGQDVAIIAVGLLPLALETAKEYHKKTGKNITVINPKFLTGLDEELLEKLKKDHKAVITIEDGELDGGYGQRIASYYGNSAMKVYNLGISKKFHDNFHPEQLLKEHGMSVEDLIALIEKIF